MLEQRIHFMWVVVLCRNSDIRSCKKQRKPKQKENLPTEKRRSSRVQTKAERNKSVAENACPGNREVNSEQLPRHTERGNSIFSRTFPHFSVKLHRTM